MDRAKEFIKEVFPYIIIIIVVLLIRMYVVTPVRVNGPSMDRTLANGELMILNRLGKVKRGSIVVVDIGYEKVIKRVVGMPGDSIYCVEGTVYINDKEYKEDYISTDTSDFEKVYLKDNEYFVMGDNRVVSMDSRAFGPVNKKQIMGVSEFVIFPFTKIGNANSI